MILGMLADQPVHLPTVDTVLRPPTGEPHPLTGNGALRVESYCQRQEAQGFSQEAAQLISKSLRTGTRAAYNSAWNKFPIAGVKAGKLMRVRPL